ncbi:unnamed protein product [Calypogeia fissa]
MKDVMEEDELDQLIQLIPRDELLNFDQEKARQFLAKELYGSSKDVAEQRSVTPAEFTGKRSPPLALQRRCKKRRTILPPRKLVMRKLL